MLRLMTLLFVCFWGTLLLAQSDSPKPAPAIAADGTLATPADTVPLNPEKTILLDKSRNRLLLRTKVCLREGVLEMFICPKQTKEHESVLSLAGKAQVIHAGLLAMGLTPGHPARFHPEFAAPQGPKLDLFVNWIDADKKPQRMRAQEWIRHSTHRYFEAKLETVPREVQLGEGENSLRYDAVNKMLIFFGTMTPELKKRFLTMSSDQKYQQAVNSLFDQGVPRELEADFVFAGSSFLKREDGSEFYTAEAGSLVCVANFGDALIDINMRSTASNDSGLLFEPWTERIPSLQTDVLVEIVPVK